MAREGVRAETLTPRNTLPPALGTEGSPQGKGHLRLKWKTLAACLGNPSSLQPWRLGDGGPSGSVRNHVHLSMAASGPP